MSEKLTPAEFCDLYRERCRIDREEFRVHWRQIAFDSILTLVGNAALGFAFGGAVAVWSIGEALRSLPV